MSSFASLRKIPPAAVLCADMLLHSLCRWCRPPLSRHCDSFCAARPPRPATGPHKHAALHSAGNPPQPAYSPLLVVSCTSTGPQEEDLPCAASNCQMKLILMRVCMTCLSKQVLRHRRCTAVCPYADAACHLHCSCAARPPHPDHRWAIGGQPAPDARPAPQC